MLIPPKRAKHQAAAGVIRGALDEISSGASAAQPAHNIIVAPNAPLQDDGARVANATLLKLVSRFALAWQRGGGARESRFV